MFLRPLLILLLALTICETANILYLMPYNVKSHYIGMKYLALELATRGHHVYAVTPYYEESYPSTYHQLKVDSDSIWNRLFTKKPDVYSSTDYSFSEFQMLCYRSGFLVNELVFNSTDVQIFLEADHNIDLVISEMLYNEALYMFAYKYQAPLIFVTTFGNSFKTNYYSNNPLQLSTLYHEYGRSESPTSFIGRLKNLYFCAYEILMLKYWYFPRQQEIAKTLFKNLPEPVPSLEELASNASLVLMNSHFSVDTPAAYLPNFIEVAGLHVKASLKPLPDDLQKILNDAINGVVFMSFGSIVQISELGKDKLDAFLTVFGELKQTVLMKWEDSNLPKTPKNVILRKWFPQKDVLAHPNIKLFIGHGGLLGLQETITAGIPIIGIPVFADQYLNILGTVKEGHGELLELKDISVESVRNAVNKVLNDKRYADKAKEIAVRFNDRPMSAIDTAVWWIEYVLRHKGAPFIKNPTLQMNFFASQMLDIYLLIVIIIIIAVIVLTKVVLWVLSFKKQPSRKAKKQ